MFNLDQAISEWRQKMADGGIKTPAILDELESHLREDAEKLAKSGVLSEGEAFKVAVDRMGQSELLKAEFAKVATPPETRWGKIIGIACGIFVVGFTLWAAPWLLVDSEISFVGRAIGLAAVALTLCSVVSWRFSHKYLPVIRTRRARTIAVAVCCLASVACFFIFGQLLVYVIVPRFFHGSEFVWRVVFDAASGKSHIERMKISTFGDSPVFSIGISLLWAMAVAAVPGAIAYGLEEAARRRMKERACV